MSDADFLAALIRTSSTNTDARAAEEGLIVAAANIRRAADWGGWDSSLAWGGSPGDIIRELLPESKDSPGEPLRGTLPNVVDDRIAGSGTAGDTYIFNEAVGLNFRSPMLINKGSGFTWLTVATT